jgi:hypothetical protein
MRICLDFNKLDWYDVEDDSDNNSDEEKEAVKGKN